MSMTNCSICEKIYDSDFELEDYKGECICDACFENTTSEDERPDNDRDNKGLLSVDEVNVILRMQENELKDLYTLQQAREIVVAEIMACASLKIIEPRMDSRIGWVGEEATTDEVLSLLMEGKGWVINQI